MHGHVALDIKGGPKSADILTEGYKIFKFKDGQTVKCSQTNHKLWNIMFGDLSWQNVGEWTLEDEKNGLTAFVKMGTIEGKA